MKKHLRLREITVKFSILGQNCIWSTNYNNDELLSLMKIRSSRVITICVVIGGQTESRTEERCEAMRSRIVGKTFKAWLQFRP
jgi:hypothetical protein